MIIYEQMLLEYKRVENEIKSIDLSLSKLPKNKFYVAGNKQYTKWYEIRNKKRVYIPKAQRDYAEKLAVSKFLSMKRKELEQEKIAIEFYLKNHIPTPLKCESLLEADSGYAELLSSYFKPSSQDLVDWMNCPYEQNPTNLENLNIKTLSGKYVRSKSEAIIEMCLHLNQIPYRYECLLSFPDWSCYPDFTLLHPKTKELFYWEHLGMMDNPMYSRKAYKKIQEYIDHGIIPNQNLILTYETKTHPLSSLHVEQIIKHNFL